ncbi:MAG: hypothetical protein GY751_13300 [Bacteroidetes bacterium]|nr:hypothetical protein [Bacteroidota bacterium]
MEKRVINISHWGRITVLLLFFTLMCRFSAGAQTSWVDSMDVYARDVYLPAKKYIWTWQRASLLRSMVLQYELRPEDEKPVYLEYVQTAMEATAGRAHGKRPNAVASGHGMAFLYKITGDERYKLIADKIYADFLNIIRVPDGGVSHKAKWAELWDDSIFMIGVYMLEMFRATGEEKYLDHLVEEIRSHRKVLRDDDWGLWVHGWDCNDKNHICLCGQKNWADDETRRSAEIWGRGNGWVIVTLSDALNTIPADHHYREELSGYLYEMIEHLPDLQDETTGHWYQLPVRKDEEGNFIESSCTAMFAYGMLAAIQNGLVDEKDFKPVIDRAYYGLRQFSIKHIDGPYLTSRNVCKGTCCGDKEYYFNRKSVEGKPFGLAMPIMFGMEYERYVGLRP